MDAFSGVTSHPPRITSHPSSCWKSVMKRRARICDFLMRWKRKKTGARSLGLNSEKSQGHNMKAQRAAFGGGHEGLHQPSLTGLQRADALFLRILKVILPVSL